MAAQAQGGTIGAPADQHVLAGLAEAIAIAALYFLVAKGSLAFASINPSATPIWPPTGLALGLALFRGYRVLPAIFLGAFAANATTTGGLAVSGAIATGNTLEALVGALLINAWANGREAFQTPSGIGKFAIVVIAASTPISATTGVLALGAGGFAAWSNFPGIWATWWLGDAAGAVMVCPAIALWAADFHQPSNAGKQKYETAALHAFAVAVGAIAFSPLLPSAPGRSALAFLAVLPLLWAALRRGPRDTSTVALILSGFAIWGVASGEGPFIQPVLNASFLLLVSFVASVTLPSLALSAAMTSRDRTIVRRVEDYQRLVDSVRDHAIFMLDPDGRVATWNSGAARIKKYSEEDILGQHFSCFYSEEERARGEPERALASAAEQGRYESEGWRLRRDGSRFRAEAVLSAIRDDRGRLIGFAEVTRDITDRRATQAALEKTRERLQQAQRLESLGQLTGGVAHDFNNLLTVISGALHALEKDRAPEQLEKVLQEMRDALERGTRLTRQLLAFASRDSLNPARVEVAKAIGDMRAILERSLGAGIGLEFKLPADLWPINVDLGQLEMVILNLVMNGRDAMPDGGILIIEAANIRGPDQRALVRICVRDTGIGMTTEVRARAFEPFFSTKEPGRGTGLGLSQAYGFANQSGGTMEIESEPGKGTAIALLLPASDSPDSASSSQH